jgi:hypothetical protein
MIGFHWGDLILVGVALGIAVLLVVGVGALVRSLKRSQ